MTKKETAIYETDVQGDFTYRTGALFVNGQKPWTNKPYGAEAALPNVFALHDYAAENDWRVLGSVDRHFYEDAELIRNEGGVFEDHCMNGTVGQLRLQELEPQKDIYVRAKDGPLLGQRVYTDKELKTFVDAEAQLIFEKQSYDVGTNPNFETTFKMLLDDGLKNVVVNGFATDYCVLAAVNKMADLRDQYNANVNLYVVDDAIEAVNINFEGKLDGRLGEKALEELVERGVRRVKTADVLEGKLQ